MTEPLRLLPPRVPLVDPKTGNMSRDWYMFFQQLYERVGGATAPSNADIAADLFEDAGSGELTAQLFGVSDDLHQAPPVVEALAADDQTPPLVPALGVDDQTPPSVCCLLPDDQTNEVAELREQVTALTDQLNGAMSGIDQLQSQIAELLKEIDALNQAITQP
jgi:hypothetical protein